VAFCYGPRMAIVDPYNLPGRELDDHELAVVKARLWDDDDDVEDAASFGVRRTVLVALGDSWFDYPLGLDVLDQLRRKGYRIHRFAQAGDTLENMIYGADYHPRHFQPKPAKFIEVLETLKRVQADAFLFSGGGNDVAGESLEAFLNHAKSGLPILRDQYLDEMIEGNFRCLFEHMIGEVQKAAPKLPIFIHGYGYPIPDGRGYRRLGFQWAGPWLRPPLTKKGILGAKERYAVMEKILNRFNAMLADLAEKSAGVHYVDNRQLLGPDDWDNELHPDRRGFEEVAKVLAARIEKVRAGTGS
jgi:hypothetical protein